MSACDDPQLGDAVLAPSGGVPTVKWHERACCLRLELSKILKAPADLQPFLHPIAVPDHSK